MRIHILVLSCVLKAALSLYIDQGCTVKSEWREHLAWTDTHVSAWKPLDHNTNILELRMFSRDSDSLGKHTYDKVNVTSEEVTLTVVRMYKIKTRLTYSFPQLSGEGWRDYIFSVKSNYVFTSVADNASITLNVTRDLEPDYILVKGSNITLNCPSEVRIWNVTGSPVFIPMSGSDQHSLSIFSKQEVMPTLRLDTATARLSYNASGITLTDKESVQRALPAFTQHNLTLDCSYGAHAAPMCVVGANNMSDKRLFMNELPRTLEISGRERDKFYVLLHDHNPKTNLADPNAASSSKNLQNGEGVLMAVLVVVGLAIVTGIGLILWQKEQLKTKRDAGQPDENELLIYRHEKLPSLLTAVEEDKIDMLHEALEDEIDAEDFGRVYVEAHLLQRKEIIQILKPKSNLEWEEVIKKVLERYQEREDEMMRAARKGLYRSRVDLLLRQYELPATTRDAEGKTILHHAVYAKDYKGLPKWPLKSLRSLLKDHHCFVNAVDYEGRTCLHILAERATSVHSLNWDGQFAQVPDVWLKMAKILIEFGCRSVQDYSEHLPHEIAKQNGNVQLSDYLQQEYKKSVVENVEESDSFEELVAAAQENDVKKLEKLLVHVSPLLPLDATQDPLTEAVKRGNLDAALVLMCAGAPLCGLPLDCITPLEAAHGRADLPALLPAILRKEYANKLKDEASRISSRDPQSVELQENIEGFATEVEEIGPKAAWRFTRDYEDKDARSKKARELLCAAAGLGLPLSCQMFGLEDVHLHPLPREDTPIRSALKGKKENMLYILFRDLHMSLSVGNDSRLPSAFYKEALKSEIKKFKQFCIKMKLLAGEEPDSLLHELSGALNGSLKSSISKDMMLCISGYGLVLLLSKFIKHTDINCVIDDISGFTMLHVSALYGRLAMVEYLLFNGADINIESKDGFTAAHVAAMKGQMECMAYLQAYPSRGRTKVEQDTSTIPVSIHELAEGYKALVREFSPLLLPAKFGLDILSKPQDENGTNLILQRKMEHLNISDNDSFRTYITGWRTKARKENIIEREMESLLQEMGGKTNSKFKGKLVQRDPKSTVVIDFTNDFLQMFWEVEKKSYGDFQVIHNGEEVCSIEVKYEDQKMDAITKRFREEFYHEVKTTLATYKFKIPTIWRSYPRIAMEELGVTIYLVWYDGNITRQVRVLIVPLLRTEYPEDTDGLPALVSDCLQEEVPVYITRTKENGKWIYVMTQLEDMIVSRLTDEQQLVLSACRFLCNVLNPCWWFPRVQSKRHGSIWHSYAISASDVPDHKQILTLFLEEITQTQKKDWESSKFLERVSGVYKRAIYNDNSNNPRTLEDLKTFLDPKHSHFIPSSGALAIVDALSSLQMGVPKSRRKHIFVC